MSATVLFLAAAGLLAGPAKSPQDALRPLNPLVGSWKATGTPEGTREERQAGFWTETVAWGWQFKGQDAWLTATIDNGKHFTRGDLRYLPDRDLYQFTLTTPTKAEVVFVGPLTAGKQKDQTLTLERTNPATKETERLVVSLLHANRYLVRFDTRPAAGTAFARKYQVGATKEGEAFANVPKGPECVVTGGKGTTPVSYKGKTYYVCCSGCKDAFTENPEKFVQEFEKKNK